MLYNLTLGKDSGGTLTPVQFSGLGAHRRIEKDLEALLDAHLLDVLFEEAPLFPVFRERQRQAEADIYALNADADLVIFELKRGGVGAEAVHQLLRYVQDARHRTDEGRRPRETLPRRSISHARAAEGHGHGSHDALRRRVRCHVKSRRYSGPLE